MTTTTTDFTSLDSVLVLDNTDVDAMPWEPTAGCVGVDHKDLWRFGSYVQALLRYQPGAFTPGRPHYAAHHHIWIVSGTACIGDRRLTAGSYVHVPPGVSHELRAGPEGCTVLQMHRPHAPIEAATRASTTAAQTVGGRPS